MAMVSQDWAFVRRDDGRFVIGKGPFRSQATAPGDGIAFYCNDFSLSDPLPWKIPTEVSVCDDLSSLATIEELEIEWSEPESDVFASVFSEVHDAIRHGKLEKAVPVVVEKGTIHKGDAASLMRRIETIGAQFHPYGFSINDCAYVGATPERLFTLKDGLLKTMALAGTARKEDSSVFAVDEKEIREHEFVAGTLASNLSLIGMVRVHNREVMDLGALVHFHTAIEVELYRDMEPEELIIRMHPTPALGTLPRTDLTLNLLKQWRERLDCSPYFGAPFALLENGQVDCLVAIRAIYWKGNQIFLPAGCGVIDESRLVNEWRELRLKRESVKRFFGV